MSISPTPSSVEAEKKPFPGPHTDPTAPKETIVPDGVKSRHVEDEELDGGDSSLEATISEREMSWQRTAVLLFTEYIVLGASTLFCSGSGVLPGTHLPHLLLASPNRSHPRLPLLVPGPRHGRRYHRHARRRPLGPLHLACPLAVLHGVRTLSFGPGAFPFAHATDLTADVLPSMTALRLFCSYPQCRDIADVSYYIFGEKRIYWYAAFVGLAANNLFIVRPLTGSSAM
jgi:hypothetical protein